MQITFNSYEEMMDFMEKIQACVGKGREGSYNRGRDETAQCFRKLSKYSCISAGTECATRIYAGCSDCTCTDCSSN